jgi:hypothetical protein
LIVAGCTGPPPPAPPPPHVDPTLAVLDESECPLGVQVRLTNGDSRSLNVSFTGFKLVDANGTVAPPDAAATAHVDSGGQYSSFPSSVLLATGESAEGVVIFSGSLGSRPWNLSYDLGGYKAKVEVPVPAPGHSGCAPPPPPTITLQGGGSWVSSAGGASYTLTITSVTSGAGLTPTTLLYIVSNAAQTTLYSGAAGQNTTSGGFAVNVVYQDAQGTDVVNAGDSIMITVDPAANNPLVGGTIAVIADSRTIGTGAMP